MAYCCFYLNTTNGNKNVMKHFILMQDYTLYFQSGDRDREQYAITDQDL